MEILFIGRVFNPEKISSIIKESKNKIGFANHNFEMSIYSGFRSSSLDNKSLNILSIPAVYSFPHNNKSFYTKNDNFQIYGFNVNSIGFCNLLILNKIQIIISLSFKLIKFLFKNRNSKKVIIVNTADIFILIPFYIAKLLNRNFSSTLILPDIPHFITSLDKKVFLKTKIINLLDSIALKIAHKFDSYVFLTENMKQLFTKKTKFVVIEGFANTNLITSHQIIDNKENISNEILLYTGSLKRKFGIMKLISAFENLDCNDIELWICGSGECEEEIMRKSIINQKIKFLGLVENDRAIELQQKSTILINPRNDCDEFTKFSFPSKIIEYLLACKPLIMYKLPGIPTEYYEFVYIPKDNSINELARLILEVKNLPKDQKFTKALRGREYVIKYKNSEVQTKKILDLISVT